MDKLSENIEKALREYMERNRIKPAEMARRCKLTPGGLHRILKRDRTPTIATLVNIAEATGVSVADLTLVNK